MGNYVKSFNFASLAFVLALAMIAAGCNDGTLLEAEQPSATSASSDEYAPAKRQSGSITTAVTGTVEDGGTFAGDLTITRFYQQAGELLAEGTLTGTLTDAAGDIIGNVTNLAISGIPANVLESSTCEILFLELGPLELDLLGLQVNLSQITLEITAEAGEGNLLGNLLCAVANLLNPGGSLSGIANLLNQILSILGNITL